MSKKLLLTVLLAISLLTGTVTTAFAAGTGTSTYDIAYQYYDEIFQEAGKLPEADRERVRHLANALWDLENRKILAADYAGTIEDGKKIISEATSTGYQLSTFSSIFSLDNNAMLFGKSWESKFEVKAQSLGMDAGDSLTAFFGNGAFFTSSTSQIADNTSNVNILTWKSPAGSTALHQGQISTILNIFDTGFRDFSNIIVAISIALAIAFGGASIVSLSMDRNASGDALSREFFKLLLGIWVMCNYKYFALLLIRLGTLLTETVKSVGIDGAQNSTSYQSTIAIWESFKELLSEIPSPNAMQAATSTGQLAVTTRGGSSNTVLDLLTHLGGTAVYNFVVSLIVYAVAIEIGIRYLFTPLAIADLYSEKMRSNGFNWLKKLLAVSLQGALIFLMIYGATKLKNSYGLNSIAVNLCTIGMVASSKLLANEIVGAH